MTTRIIAHRGFSSLFPENTMLAFREALANGATGLECDVQLTADGEIIIFHDEEVYRITGNRGLVKDFSWNEISRMDAGRHKGEKFRGEGIPRLQDLLELIKNRDIILNIELKNGIIPYPNLEKKAIEMVEKFSLAHQVIISSFNHPSLLTVKEHNPNIKTSLLFFARMYKPWKYTSEVKVDGIHPFWMGVDGALLKGAQKNGLFVNPFTVNNLDDMYSLLKAGVDGIITDYPDRLAQLIHEKMPKRKVEPLSDKTTYYRYDK